MKKIHGPGGMAGYRINEAIDMASNVNYGNATFFSSLLYVKDHPKNGAALDFLRFYASYLGIDYREELGKL